MVPYDFSSGVVIRVPEYTGMSCGACLCVKRFVCCLRLSGRVST